MDKIIKKINENAKNFMGFSDEKMDNILKWILTNKDRLFNECFEVSDDGYYYSVANVAIEWDDETNNMIVDIFGNYPAECYGNDKEALLREFELDLIHSALKGE